MAAADDVVTTREKCCKGIFWMFRALVWLADLGIICWVMSETFIFCSNGSSVWLSLQSFSFKLSFTLSELTFSALSEIWVRPSEPKLLRLVSRLFCKGMFYAVYPEFNSSRADECPDTSVNMAFVILTIKLVRPRDYFLNIHYSIYSQNNF